MTRLIPLVFVFLLGGSLCSCVSHPLVRYRNAGEDIPQIQYNIKKGKSTRKQVIGWLGEPMMKSTRNGREIWIYSGHTMERKGMAGFIEGLGLGAQGAGAVARAGAAASSAAATGGMMLVAGGLSGMLKPKSISSQSATIEFDAAGIVSNYWVTQMDMEFDGRGLPKTSRTPAGMGRTAGSVMTSLPPPPSGKVKTDQQGTQYLVQ